jgi:hypothetical protein
LVKAESDTDVYDEEEKTSLGEETPYIVRRK